MSGPDKLTREVLKHHHDEAFKWAMSCCHYDCETAREVMQLVYIAILEGKAVFHGRSSLRTWLFSVIRQIAWQNIRSDRSTERFLSRFMNLVAVEMEGGDESGSLEKEDNVKQLCTALENLSNQQRQIIELVYYREFTLAEAAEVLDISIGSVRTQFHRAKKQLARYMAPSESRRAG